MKFKNRKPAAVFVASYSQIDKFGYLTRGCHVTWIEYNNNQNKCVRISRIAI